MRSLASARLGLMLIGALVTGTSLALVTVRHTAANAGPPASSVTAVPLDLTPVEVGTRPGEVPLDRILAATISSLGLWWDRNAPLTFGVEHRPLAAVEPYRLSGGVLPECDIDDPTPADFTMQAYYCPTRHAVIWDAEELAPQLHRRYGPLAMAFVLAHEWTHGVQASARQRASTLVSELQADCFAGAWLADQASHPIIGPLLDDFAVQIGPLMDRIGDTSGADHTDRHGTAGERLGAYDKGAELGPAACISLGEA